MLAQLGGHHGSVLTTEWRNATLAQLEMQPSQRSTFYKMRTRLLDEGKVETNGRSHGSADRIPSGELGL